MDPEIRKKLDKINRKLNLALALQFICLLLIAGLGTAVYLKYQEYSERIDKAFETIQQIDGVVEKMENAYDEYAGRIQDLFDKVDQLSGVVQSIKDAVSNLPDLSDLPDLSGLGSFFGIH